LICTDTSRAPDRRRAPHTGRGSDSFVLIEAGGFYPKFYGTQIIWGLHQFRIPSQHSGTTFPQRIIRVASSSAFPYAEYCRHYIFLQFSMYDYKL